MSLKFLLIRSFIVYCVGLGNKLLYENEYLAYFLNFTICNKRCLLYCFRCNLDIPSDLQLYASYTYST